MSELPDVALYRASIECVAHEARLDTPDFGDHGTLPIQAHQHLSISFRTF